MAVTVAEIRGKSTGINKVTKDLDSVSKSTERLGRQQTRLGQASAASGRQFSAQAAGLGGLVAAYAGAAATIFAITAAFDALNRAARAEQTITGVNALANAIGESGPEIIKGLQEITKGQLSIVQTAELANLALSSGFSADQINNLAEISLKASRALGRDLTDSFNRLVRGVTKLEPELLDELGIFTRIEPAAEAYAAAVGKTVSQLSNFEKRQAFANAVAEEGSQKFRDIDTSANTSSESLEKLSATISNIGISVGGFIAKVIAPLADALTGNLIASIGAFGILAKTVFGTTLREAQGSLQSFSGSVDSLGDKITDKLAGGTKRLTAANETLGESLGQVNLRVRAVSAANEAEFKTLIQAGRAKELTTAQTKRLNSIITQEIALLKTQQKALANSNLSQKQLEIQTTRLTNKMTQLNAALVATETRLAATPKAARLASGAFKVVATGVSVATSKLLGFLNGVTLFITVVSTIATVGSIILDAFGFLDPLIERINLLIRQVKVLLDITKEDAQQRDTASVVASLIPETVDIDTAGAGGYRDAAKNVGNNFREKVIEAIREGNAKDRESFIAALIPGDLENQTNRQARAVVDALLPAINEAFDAVKFFGPDTLQGIAEFADATGRTLRTANRQLDRTASGGLVFAKAASLGLSEITRAAAVFKDTSDITDPAQLAAAEKQNALAIDRLQSQELSANLQEALNSGSATAEQIEKRRGAILSKINNLTKENAELNAELILDLKAQLKTTDRQAQAQLAILNARKQLRKTFSAEISAAGQLSKLFVEDSKGRVQLIKRESEGRSAQIAFAQKIFELGKEDLRRRRAGVQLSDIEAQRAQAAADAQAALSGNLVKSITAARELSDQFAKIELSLNKQKDIAATNLLIEQDRQKIAADQRAAARESSDSARAINLIKLQSRLNKLTQEGSDLEMKGQRAALRAALGSTPFLSQNRANQIELILRRQELQELVDAFDKQAATLEKINNEQRNSILDQLNLAGEQLGKSFSFDKDGGLIEFTKKQADNTDRLSRQFDNQLKLANQQAQARKDERDLQITSLEERNRLVIQELKNFDAHIDGIARVLAADRVAREEALAGDKFSTEAADSIRKALSSGELPSALRGSIQSRLSDAGAGSLSTIQNADVATLRSVLTDIRAFTTGGEVSSEINELLKTLTDPKNKEKFQSLRDTSQEVFDAEEKLNKARNEGARAAARETAEAKIVALQSALTNSNLEYQISLAELANALAEAGIEVQNFSKSSDLAGDNIRKALGQIDDTIESKLISGFQDLNNAFIDGTLSFKNAKEGFRDFAQSLIRQIQQIFFTETIARPAAGFLKDIVMGGFGETSSESSMLDNNPNANAAGGIVHMAAGGMLRDRVPALLEPGEFVMKKAATKGIGEPALNRMNATGSAGGNVVVNIKNEGTPQDATASQPRFDGEKFVIDIVTRDLRNNGPIRKSMRGGA